MGSSSAVIDPSATLGENTHVWHFSVILQHVVIGDDVSIGSHCEVGRGSTIGDRTRLGKGVFLPPNSVVGDDVFIGPGTIFCDDRFPRVGNKSYKAEPPQIEDGASIGAGVVVLPGVKIGLKAMIGAGAVVTKDVPAYTKLRGEPSRVATRLNALS